MNTSKFNARRWKHENGGIIKYQNPSSPLLEKGYTTNNEILQNPDTFNVNWYKYRAEQLQDVIKENPLSAKYLISDLGFFENPKKLSNDRVINSVINNFSQQLKDVKEFTTKSALRDHVGRTILTDEYYNKYPHLNNTNPDLIGPPKPIPDKELEPILRRQLIKGAHWPQYNTIIYDSVIGNDVGNKIHERTHALINRFNPILNKLRNSEEFLRNKSHADPYYDDPEEIYARLMFIRKENNLDPTHIYTKDELHKMRADKNFKDDFLINRYSDDFVLMLLNDVAQNTIDPNRIDYKDPVTFVKDGGILKAQDGTGNLLTPHPLSPVGIALNQAKIMAKMKGEQQHLPPGVKEVVGPDGKKIAIRTEQPLVPLEQSIAEWLPGTGDVAEVGYIANDVKNGNYGSAALAATMVALPGNVGKIFRKSDVPVSKLTEAERLGIPKGERNQPAKAPTKNQTYNKTANLESDKDYLEDIEAIQQGFLGKTFLDSEHEALLDWFNSPQYKERLVKQGFSEEQINNLLSNIKDKLSRKNLKYAVDLNSIREWGIGSGGALKIDPQLYPAYEAMTNGNIKIGGYPINWSFIQLKKGVDLDEMIPHEVGGHHLESLVAEFNEPYTSQQITEIGKKATISSGLPEGYYPSWWETRARALTIAKQMREAGWNPNSPEQVKVWLNKHLLKDRNTNVVQGALYYDRPGFVKAVSEGLKNGGKL